VSADFMSGYGLEPADVAESVTRCVATGVAGLSIEDGTGDPTSPLYNLPIAVERVRAARKAIDLATTCSSQQEPSATTSAIRIRSANQCDVCRHTRRPARMSRWTIEPILQESDWNKSEAARRLGLTRTQLYERLRRYGLDDHAANVALA